MENWIGVGVWIVLGAVIGLAIRTLVSQPQEQKGHVPLIAILGAFGGVVGGMLGVGLFHFDHPTALSPGGMGGAVVLALVMSWTYRVGIRSLT